MYRMESASGKTGATLFVLAVALFLRRFLLRSIRLFLSCLIATEVTVLLIIAHFTGYWFLRLSEFQYNGWWLYVFTWNVAIACIIGMLLGTAWDRNEQKKNEN